MTYRSARATLFLAAALIVASPASAERADRTKPINLEADTVTLDDIAKLSTYTGNVILTQGTLILRADRVQVTQKNGEVDRVSATGRPVAFRQKLDGRDEFIEAFADRLEYNGATGEVELIGQARLRRGQDELRGARISYNTNTEFYRVEGGPAAQTPGGRVRAVIRPRSEGAGAP